MLHEIDPGKFEIGYSNYMPEKWDTVIVFNGELVGYKLDGDQAILPKCGELSIQGDVKFYYLFSIDEERYFIIRPRDEQLVSLPNGYEMHEYGIFREVGPRHIAFAIVTAQHLHQWYVERQICGKCGAGMEHSELERACICSKCGLTEYPKIAPCVIVGVIHGEFMLLTRYRKHAYRRYALIAGFVEAGESFEDAVRREVFEETGVNVKHIRYYKSQPWGFTSTILAGFFCELDGDPAIEIDEDELSEAVWLQREAIPPAISDISLTSEMMELFRLGNEEAVQHNRA